MSELEKLQQKVAEKDKEIQKLKATIQELEFGSILMRESVLDDEKAFLKSRFAREKEKQHQRDFAETFDLSFAQWEEWKEEDVNSIFEALDLSPEEQEEAKELFELLKEGPELPDWKGKDLEKKIKTIQGLVREMSTLYFYLSQKAENKEKK